MIENIKLREQIEQEIQKLTDIERKLQIRLINAPEGTLYIKKTGMGKYPQFFIRRAGKSAYLPVRDHSSAPAYAQKEYDEKVLAIVCDRLQSAEQMLEKYKKTIGDEYAGMSDEKKKLITPIEPTDEEYVKEWYAQHPGYANPYPNHSALYTERGEMVRSKSEKILADLFYKRNIPYVYEPKMEFGNGKTIYPDFLLLDIVRRKTYIYEHFGMMDNPDYVRSALEKLSQYSDHGYWVGDTLLFSFETSSGPLNTKNVESMLRHFM
ncbi:MAG: hypothetical protein ACI4FY_11580 [Acetatifactor sp.]